jgi:hypothetical protein
MGGTCTLALTEQYVRKIMKQLKDKGAIERVEVRKNGSTQEWILECKG